MKSTRGSAPEPYNNQYLAGAPAAAPAVSEQTQKFSLFALTMMVVGSMVGAGIGRFLARS